MGKEKYPFFKLVDRLKSLNDIQEIKENSKVQIQEHKPRSLKMALTRLISYKHDQLAENTNKKQDTNNDIYKEAIKGFEAELADFDDAVEEALVTCNINYETNMVQDRSLVLMESCDKDDEVSIVEERNKEHIKRYNQDDVIPLEKECSLDPLDNLKIVRKLTVIEVNSLDPLASCNQENDETVQGKSIESL